MLNQLLNPHYIDYSKEYEQYAYKHTARDRGGLPGGTEEQHEKVRVIELFWVLSGGGGDKLN